MAKFMLILHSNPATFEGLSPEEMQRVFEKYQAWREKIQAADRLVVSDKLMDEGGKVLTMQKGQVNVVAGPYSEAKEVVAGYYMLRAADYDEAIALIQDCPHLHFGRIELRQTDPMGCGAE
ncbi:YciI family protein [Singulisphaera rosea]